MNGEHATHLNEILQLLQATLKIQTSEQNQIILNKYEQVQQYPDYVDCLLHVLSFSEYSMFHPLTCVLIRRSMGGVNVDYMRIFQCVSPLLVTPSARSSAANVISCCFMHLKDQERFQVLQTLLGVINNSSDKLCVEGALLSLEMILDDHSPIFFRPALSSLLKEIGQSLIHHMSNPVDSIRSIAVDATNAVINYVTEMEGLLEAILQRWNDPLAVIRTVYCQMIITMAMSMPDVLKKYIQAIISSMMQLMNDQNENVRQYACGIWGTFSGVYPKDLMPLVNQLLQLLIPHTVLTPELIDELNNESIEDSLDGDGSMNERKQAGISLEEMAMTYGNDFLGVLLPFITEQIQSSDWKAVEASTYIFGCIIEKGITQKTPELMNVVRALIERIISQLGGTPMIQYITLWALFRIGDLLVTVLSDAQMEQLFTVVIQLSTSANARIQYEALQLLSSLLDYDIKSLEKHSATVLQLVIANVKSPVFVGVRCMEMVSQMAELFPGLFTNNDLLRKLIAVFVNFAHQYERNPTVMESCVYNLSFILPRFSTVDPAISTSLKTFALTIFQNSEDDYQMQSSCLFLLSACIAVNPMLAVDILSALAPQLPSILRVLKDVMITSAYCLFGDFIQNMPAAVKPLLPQVLPSVLFLLETAKTSTLGNVYWCLGLLLQHCPSEMAPYFSQLASHILLVIQNDLSDATQFATQSHPFRTHSLGGSSVICSSASAG